MVIMDSGANRLQKKFRNKFGGGSEGGPSGVKVEIPDISKILKDSQSAERNELSRREIAKQPVKKSCCCC
jgi:hypothetical protein